MVLVDYDQHKSQTIDNFNTEKSKPTQELDTQIQKILQNSELNDHDKCKLYIETLRKYLYFMNEDLKNKELKTLELNNNFQNLLSKLNSEVNVKPAVKRLSKGCSPLKRKRINKTSPNSGIDLRKKSSRIPKLKKVPLPVIENWISMQTEAEDE